MCVCVYIYLFIFKHKSINRVSALSIFYHAATIPSSKVNEADLNFNLGGAGEGQQRWIDGSGSAEIKTKSMAEGDNRD